MRRWAVLVGLVAACGRIDFDATASGPDANPLLPDGMVGGGSYTWTEGTGPFAPPAGAQLVAGFMNGDDENNYTLALPFEFPFYGIAYDSVTVNVNGYVSFAAPITGDDSWQNECPFDPSIPSGIIAVFWDDLFAPSVSEPFGSISHATAGAGVDATFTIEWRDLGQWYLQGGMYASQGSRVTHQLVLRPDGTFTLHYGPRSPPLWDRECGVDRHRGCSATIGVKPPAGASTLVQCATEAGPGPGYVPIDEGRMLVFTPR